MANFIQNNYRFFLILMSLLYVAAGISHYLNPERYIEIMPPWLPQPLFLVYMSGMFEFLLGILLMHRLTRQFAAWGIIILLIAVFPANIQMAINYGEINHPYLWLAVLRLPLQIFLIWWAWVYTQKLSETANGHKIAS